MPNIGNFPFKIGGNGKSEGLLGKNILGNTMIAASNTLRKSLAKVSSRRAPSSQKVSGILFRNNVFRDIIQF